MAKKGIKVKSLAKELGTRSRTIIDRCRMEGINVQNSVTVLDSQTEALVRYWLTNGEMGKDTEKSV